MPERQGHHPIGMLLDEQLLSARREIVEMDRIISASSFQTRSIWTEAEIQHHVRNCSEHFGDRSMDWIEQNYFSKLSRRSAGCGQQRTIPTVGQALCALSESFHP